MQLILYPIIESTEGPEKFGLVLTITSYINIVGTVLGSSISNVYLVNFKNFKENKLNEVIKFIFRKSFFISLTISIILIIFFKNEFPIFELMSIPLLILFMQYRSFLISYYRIFLNFNEILKLSLLIVIGYLIAIPLYNLISYWPILILSGELFGFVYLLKTTPYMKIENKNHGDYQNIKVDVRKLIMTNLLQNFINYWDRILLFLVSGPTSVTLYYLATFVGKTSAAILLPMAGVLLPYFTRINKTESLKLFKNIIISIIILIFFITFVSNYINTIFIEVFYPNYLKLLKNDLILANLGVIFGVCGNILQVFVLKYFNMDKTLKIQIYYFAIFSVFTLVFTILYNLSGFYWAVNIVNFLRLLYLTIILFKILK